VSGVNAARSSPSFTVRARAGVRKAAAKQGRPMPAAAASVPIAQALPVVRRALKILADREVTPQTGLLKSTLLQLDSTFSERNYGASSFLDFVEKLASSGFVQLKTSGRSVMVELNPGYTEETRPAAEGEDAGAVGSPAAHVESGPPTAGGFAQPHSSTGYGDPRRSDGGGGGLRPAGDGSHGGGGQEPAGPPLGDQAEGVRRAGQILGAATGARWPMYLRNVKQILRQTEGGFDERRYGFGGLMDLLKGCQREGFVRVERDRRGGLRVFQGSALQGAAAAPVVSRPNLPQPDVEEYENQPVETRQPDVHEAAEPAESGDEISEPIPIDTTAELLGRAKPRRPRVRAARPAPAATPRKAAVKKAAVKRPARGKKSGTDDSAGNR